MVTKGEKVADFSAPATGNRQISLSDFTGNKHLVLYFYPRDATPGCTREGQDFRDLHEQFKAADTAILGVSRDSLASHERFRQKQGFPFDLLSDADESLCRQFDVIREKNMYGRKVMGIERSTFLIDKQGVLREEWRKLKVPAHAQAVLESARQL